MIFGLPGSGKSTFAVHLAELLGLPIHHLDRHFFVEGWKERDYGEFLREQEGMVAGDRWIIDGNMMRSLEMRFARADVAIQFKFSRLLCLWRIFKRFFSRDSRIRDRAEGCSERVTWNLIFYLWNYQKKYGEVIQKLRTKYPNVIFYIFHRDREVQNFLLDDKILADFQR